MAAAHEQAPTSTATKRPPIGNPLVCENPNDTVAALRAYLADMAESEAVDDGRPRGRYLRIMVALGAVDSLQVEKLHHR